jgi:hypothetical protein
VIDRGGDLSLGNGNYVLAARTLANVLVYSNSIQPGRYIYKKTVSTRRRHTVPDRSDEASESAQTQHRAVRGRS